MNRFLGAACCLILMSISAYAQVWPGRVATTQDVFWATDQFPDPPTVLSAGIGATDLTIPVANGSLFEQYNIATIDKGASAEKVLVCAVSPSALTICAGGRGIGGTQAISHLQNAPIACRVNSTYYNTLAAEVLSIEANFAAQVVRDAPGGAASAFYQTIQYNTTTPVLPQETMINFVPGPNASIVVQDNPGNHSTDVVISALCASGGSGTEYQTVAVAGSATTPTPTLNFISANSNLTIGAVFNSGSNQTDLTFDVPSVSGSNNYQNVQINGVNQTTASTLNIQGNGITGSTVADVTTVNVSQSTGTTGSVTTSPNAPSGGACHTGVVGSFWEHTGALPALYYCNQNGASYTWTELVTPLLLNVTAQTSSISATTLLTAGSADFYRICGAIETTTAGSAGTVTSSIVYTDINGNSKTDALVPSTALSTLGAHAGACIVFWAQTGTLQYSTTVSGATGSPQYAAQFRAEAL